MRRRCCRVVIVTVLCSAAMPLAGQTDKTLHKPDVIYLPTPHEAVTAMLKLADVGPGDVVYDLGSGDGRIVIEAVRHFGAESGVGIDIDPAMVLEGQANADRSGVSGRVRFLNEDLFDADLHEASVVVLYLLPWLNRQLIPKLRRELRPGSRVISYRFDMGDWKPDQTATVNGQPVYLWRIR